MQHCDTLILAGCGTTGDLYLPSGEKGQVAPTSIESNPETFQPKTREEQEQDQ